MVQGDIDAAVLATFERFDADESGTIDASELAEALRDVGLTVDDGQVGYMLRKYDDDRNATLDINEFAQLVADLNVNTPESMQARLSLRADPRVLEQLEVWWATAVHSMGQEQYERQQMADTIAPAPAAAAELNHDEYCLVMRKIFRTMIPTDEYDAAEAEATAEEDWEHDRRGHDTLSGDLFQDGMFELADLWVETIDGADYARFLRTLFGQITERSAGGGCTFWKPDEAIAYGGYTQPAKAPLFSEVAPASSPARRKRLSRISSESVDPANRRSSFGAGAGAGGALDANATPSGMLPPGQLVHAPGGAAAASLPPIGGARAGGGAGTLTASASAPDHLGPWASDLLPSGASDLLPGGAQPSAEPGIGRGKALAAGGGSNALTSAPLALPPIGRRTRRPRMPSRVVPTGVGAAPRQLGFDPATAGDARRPRNYTRLPSLPQVGLHARLSGWESDGCAWAVSARVRRDRPPPMSWQLLVL